MIIGMDFGTTNSGMSVFDGHRMRFVDLDPASPNPQVARTALYIGSDRHVTIGRDAVETYYQHNLNRPSKLERVRVGEIEMTFAELPSFIRDVYIERDVYEPGRLFLSFKMGLADPTYLGTIVGSHYYFLEDIIALYLYTARRRAEQMLDQPLESIVLGRPVRYSDDPEADAYARERLLRSAFRAGFQTVYLQYEPVAAAYYYETQAGSAQNVLIFDFGGGTLDISVLRLGGGEKQRVLANGGIPIAGDVFDRKIVRAKLPPHFGEGTQYRDMGRMLPVPGSFYEAFSDWQSLLSLQNPNAIESLRRITKNASHPHLMQRFVQLVTSHYGLKLYDLAEASKRELSRTMRSRIRVDAPGFQVMETITRSEFERIIRSDVQAISERLDTVMADAGLQPEDIDTVIRTGGSSQIPAFIEMLETRFGPEKVRDIDTFSSVTAGLGIIGHRLESGEIDMRAYHARDYIGQDHLRSGREGIPRIDLDIMLRFVDMALDPSKAAAEEHTLLSVNQNLMEVKILDAELPESLPLRGLDEESSPVCLAHLHDTVLMLTSDYRAVTRSPYEMHNLQEAGTSIEALEGFRVDAFGQERITTIVPWAGLDTDAEELLMISTLGYAIRMTAEGLLNRLRQPVQHQMPRLRGFPAALLPINSDSDIVLVNHAGRALRLRASSIPRGETRLMNIPLKGRILGAFAVTEGDTLLMAGKTGSAACTQLADIPMSAELNTTGHKLALRGTAAAVARLRGQQPIHALTTSRLIRASLDFEGDEGSLYKRQRSENLLALL